MRMIDFFDRGAQRLRHLIQRNSHARRRVRSRGGRPDDPHDTPMPMDYFTWVAVGEGRAVVIDTGFVRDQYEAELLGLRVRVWFFDPRRLPAQQAWALARRFRVILPDLPLHGDSEDRPRHPYSPDWLADVIAGDISLSRNFRAIQQLTPFKMEPLFLSGLRERRTLERRV